MQSAFQQQKKDSGSRVGDGRTGERETEGERRAAKGTGREKEGSRRQKEADGEEFHYIFQHVKIKIF